MRNMGVSQEGMWNGCAQETAEVQKKVYCLLGDVWEGGRKVCARWSVVGKHRRRQWHNGNRHYITATTGARSTAISILAPGASAEPPPPHRVYYYEEVRRLLQQLASCLDFAHANHARAHTWPRHATLQGQSSPSCRHLPRISDDPNSVPKASSPSPRHCYEFAAICILTSFSSAIDYSFTCHWEG